MNMDNEQTKENLKKLRSILKEQYKLLKAF